ncbi:acyl-CoA dehydrogenase family protein [Actinoallomurus rhizosphaericola]|uniref:acyl-CoA dehydrogenase family protein n=1 Tax=Actinoallomurus rhizosphaericola TaxID=2952536 RepID=UPI00209227FF|nr:acyl-CoA dehydrogenase family protein [Actinoallomurus rhizosphaericola]MCO5998126.1 acyl-CoA/acyl-ACP dehydrogenase [Actinoallomurus rhizosphaericola]
MRFALDAEQRLFGDTLHELLTEAGTPALIRRWVAGDHDRTLWSALGEAGVFTLTVPERHGGAGPLPVELVVAAHELGRHAAPGPVVETLAAAALIDGSGDAGPAAEWLPRIAGGQAVVSLAPPGPVRRALDADTADLVLLADGESLASAAPVGPAVRSLDPARRLFPVRAAERLTAGPAVSRAAATAYALAALACAAQLLGLGRALLDATVEYARTRRQFGRPIGEFQAVKHHLANALTGLEFARPLAYGAALSFGSPDFPRDVSAAKAAASDAAYAAARIALQVHGAIGYTDEYDPSLWIRKIRALRSAWGTPAEHRARVLAALR